MELRVAVALHKTYWLPADRVYLPVWVGAAVRREAPPDGYARDDAGENISSRNGGYCELTALYWAWKNLPAAYLGLVHYRRYFARTLPGGRRARIAGAAELERRLAKAPVILPKKRHYWIETNYSQYVHAHHAEDLRQTRRILEETCPQYLEAYDSSMRRTQGHRFNMFVMRRDLADAYCTWLFGILFALEQRLDTGGYSENDRRVFGFVAERLLDCWIETNRVP